MTITSRRWRTDGVAGRFDFLAVRSQFVETRFNASPWAALLSSGTFIILCSRAAMICASLIDLLFKTSGSLPPT